MRKENKSPTFKRNLIYYEKQGSDRLCAVHCLNSLLQGPFYDPVILGQIGQQLDEMENELFKRKTSSQNVSVDGNFSIQVIEEALKLHGVRIMPLKIQNVSKILDEDSTVEAFVLNSVAHWYSLRKIEGVWFNLNSLSGSKLGPEIISEFYLSAFLTEAYNVGYTPFLVKNLPPLPDLQSETYQNLQSYQKLIPYDEIVNYRKNQQKGNKPKEPEEDPNKFVAFAGKGYAVSESQLASQINQFEDEEMQMAYEASMVDFIEKVGKEIPPEPQNGITVVIKFSTEIYKRKWDPNTTTIEMLKKFTKINIPTTQQIELFQPFPRMVYNLDQMSLTEAKIGNNETIFAKIIN